MLSKTSYNHIGNPKKTNFLKVPCNAVIYFSFTCLTYKSPENLEIIRDKTFKGAGFSLNMFPILQSRKQDLFKVDSR